MDHELRTPLTAGARYVALGSSFAAGAGIGPAKPGTPERCGRTALNYATLLAERLDLALDDRSCGGATTDHLLADWDELPAQLDAVTSDTRLVTVTVGGNDLDYMGLLFAASCRPEQGLTIQGHRIDCPAPPAPPGEADYARLERNLSAIADRVREQAPGALLVFVQYVTLVPPESCPDVPLSPSDSAHARMLAQRLAAITKRVAHRHDAALIEADELSRDHTACDPQPWSRALPSGYDGSQGAPWHPTRAGHAALAERLAAMLGG